MTSLFSTSDPAATVGGVLILLLIAGGVIAFAIVKYRERAALIERFEEAQEDYASALDKLARHPGRSKLRREALSRGRELIDAIEAVKPTGHKPLPNINEITIQNDLQAADTSRHSDDDEE